MRCMTIRLSVDFNKQNPRIEYGFDKGKTMPGTIQCIPISPLHKI